MKKRLLSLMILGIGALSLASCGNSSNSSSSGSSSGSSSSTTTGGSSSSDSLTELTSDGWSYDSSNNVYYKIGLVYCDSPATTDYESMGIYIPGDYVNATASGSSYTINSFTSTSVNGFTADTAPIVMPVSTPGYSAQAAPTSYKYSTIEDYMDAGLIYAWAGCRGRNNGDNYDGGAPWGVTDLKAAIRYMRYYSDVLPGNMDAIFTFGHSGGGAQSSIVGASGDSELYTPYLESIGALMEDANGNDLSDAIAGSMCWCPITSLDIADSAYEWMMGQFATSGTRADSTWTSALSDDLAKYYATYINSMGFTNNGTTLALESSSDGIYLSGSYYEYLLDVIEESLNNYLSDNTTYGGSSSSGGGPSGGGPSFKSSMYSSTTYTDKAEYVASLNGDTTWVTYDSSSDYATVTSLEGFVENVKSATKDVGAFDDLDRGQAENYVFGNGDTDNLHYDQIMADLLTNNASTYSAYSDYDSSYATEYTNDLSNTDALGIASSVRQNMYNPLYYISSALDGYGDSTVAKYWRIRSGITQGDTSLTTETNLALALKANTDVSSVDFATVWAQGHTEAERTGDAASNFIAWIEDIYA